MYVLYKERFWLMKDYDGDRHEVEKEYFATFDEARESMLEDYDRFVNGASCYSYLLDRTFVAEFKDDKEKTRSMLLYGILEC